MYSTVKNVFFRLNEMMGVSDEFGTFSSHYPLEECVERIKLHAERRYVVNDSRKSPVHYHSLIQEITRNENGIYDVKIGAYYQFKGFIHATLILKLIAVERTTKIEYHCSLRDGSKINIYLNLIVILIFLILIFSEAWFFFGGLSLLLIYALYHGIRQEQYVKEGLVTIVQLVLR